MNPGGHSDDHFEKDLQQVSGAYRQIPPDEPPALLDKAVLNQARRAVESKSVRPWNFGWIHAATTAAVIVLAVGIVLQIPEKQAPVSRDAIEYRPAEELQSKREPTIGELEGNARKQAEQESGDRLESFADEPEAAPMRQDVPADMDSAGPGMDARSGYETAAEPNAVTVQSSSAISTGADAGEPGEESRMRQARGPQDPPAVEKALTEASTPVQDGAATPVPAAPSAETEEPRQDALAPRSMNFESPAPATSPVTEDESLEEILVTGASRTETEADEEMQDDAARGERRQAESMMANEAPLAAAQAGDLSEHIGEDPDAWLQRIRELLESGDREGFESELAAFRAAWPDFELPSDLEAEWAEGTDG